MIWYAWLLIGFLLGFIAKALIDLLPETNEGFPDQHRKGAR